MNLLPFLILLGLLGITVLVLFLWRRKVAQNEDDALHVSDATAQHATQQVAVAQKLEMIDKWGKTLTIVTFVYGLIVAGIFLYQSWVQTSSLGA